MVALPTMAAEYYASFGGDDNGECASENPCDLGYIVSELVSPGDTINVAGTYDYGNFTFSSNINGTVDNHTTIQQWEGEDDAVMNVSDSTYIGSSYISFDGINFTGATSSANVIVWGDYVEFYDCEFYDTTDGGITLSEESSNIVLEGNTFYNIGGDAMSVGVSASDITISNNTIYDIDQHGIIIANQGSNIIVTGNTIYNIGSESSGIAIRSSSSVDISENEIYNSVLGININGINIEDVNIINNILHDNTSAPLAFEGNASSVNIYNNTFYEPTLFNMVVINSTFTGDDFYFQNNIFYGNGYYYLIDSMPANFLADYNLYYSVEGARSSPFYVGGTEYDFENWQGNGYDDNSLTEQDPLFISTTTGLENFHLQATSPAIDAGTTLAAVTTDYDGDVRPQGDAYDIGADEYVVTEEEDEEELETPNAPKFKNVTKKNGIVLKRKGAQVDYFKARIIKKKAKTKVFTIKRFTKKKKAFTKKQKKKLKLGKKYTCKVKACNDAGCSAWRSKNFKVKK